MKTILLTTLLFAQNNSLPVILPQPTTGEKQFTTEVYNSLLKEDVLFKKISNKDIDTQLSILSEQEKRWIQERYNLTEETLGEIEFLTQGPFNLEPYGCSWYCGGGEYIVTAFFNWKIRGKHRNSSFPIHWDTLNKVHKSNTTAMKNFDIGR